MATGTDLQTDYLALLEARAELVERIYASRIDPNVLIRKAKDREVIGSLQAAEPVAPQQRRKEEVEHLVKQVMDAASKDGSSKVFAFLQLLEEESSLHDAASLLRSKLSKRRSEQQSTPRRGHAELPKLKPLSKAEPESGVVVEEMSSLALDSPSPEAAVWGGRRQLATAGSGPSLLLGGAAVYSEQEHAENIPVDSENTVTSVEDTQPHPKGSTSVSSTVLPEARRMLEENLDLKAELAARLDKELRLQKELESMSRAKHESEEKLKEKERELQEKELQIVQLNVQRKKDVECLQQKLQSERESHVEIKKNLQEKIKFLENELQEKEAQYNQEKIELIQQKHELQLKIQEMRTEEEKLKREIMEEKVKVADLKTQAEKDKREIMEEKVKVADLKTQAEKDKNERIVKEHEQTVEEIKQKHRDSITAMEDAIRQLKKQSSSKEPDTS